MLASRTLAVVLVVLGLVALALIGLWFASRAPLEDAKEDIEPVPSNQLRELVEAAVEMAKMVAISSGQDVVPASIVENGSARARIHAGYIDSDVFGGNGSDHLAASDYRSSVDMGFRSLAAQDDDRAVLVYSGRVQHDTLKTDAVILEAYERGYPVTFRFAQPYRIDEAKSTGAFEGPIYRLPDGPPRFSQSPASRHG